jgi:hypothetical protein
MKVTHTSINHLRLALCNPFPMKINTRCLIWLLPVLLASLGKLNAQIWTQDFETNGLGTAYTSPSVFSNNPNAHYNRTNGLNISTMIAPYSQKHGSFIWAGENLNDTSVGGDGLSSKTITFASIPITGITALEFRGLFGSGNPGSGWDYSDALYVQYRIDAGPWTKLLQFAAPSLSSNSGLYHDVNLDGIGEGVSLKPSLNQFSAPITGTGTNIQIRIFASDNSVSEEFAFDYLRLYDKSTTLAGCTDPTSTNFLPTATADDGSCIRPGCTDSSALNYNASANSNNGTCVYSEPPIVINEINYNPSSYAGYTDPAYEFIELHNTGSSTVSLSGWRLATAIDFTFPAGASIVAGGYLLVASTASTYSGNGFPVYQYGGTLSNSGDIIRLYAPGNILVDEVAYYPSGCWPAGADGNGPSLELINPTLDNSLATSWCSGSQNNGSPGLNNSCYSPITGCTNSAASNFNPLAQTDDGSCIIAGCTYPSASNYNAAANSDNGSCVFLPAANNCPPDLNTDGVVNTGDLIIFIAAFGTIFP